MDMCPPDPRTTSVPRRPRTIPIALAILSLALLSGCASDWSRPGPAPTPIGALAPGFVPTPTPTPEATIDPVAGSWDDVRASPGMRVVLLTAGEDAPTRALADAVRGWAGEDQADLRTVTVDGSPIDAIVTALDMRADLIVGVGNDLIDPLTVVSANHLDQQFLVVGAELPEPTANVTAVDWAGASFRGEGNGASSTYDAASFTPERCASAVRAGVAAVLHDLTGIVIWID